MAILWNVILCPVLNVKTKQRHIQFIWILASYIYIYIVPAYAVYHFEPYLNPQCGSDGFACPCLPAGTIRGIEAHTGVYSKHLQLVRTVKSCSSELSRAWGTCSTFKKEMSAITWVHIKPWTCAFDWISFRCVLCCVALLKVWYRWQKHDGADMVKVMRRNHTIWSAQ